MMLRYLRQLTQLSIINFFFILGLLFYIQKTTPPLSKKKDIGTSQTMSTLQIISPTISAPDPQIVIEPSATLPKQSVNSNIGLHNSMNDCWIGVGDHVYNVTSYFGSHPGGDSVIAKYCGTDATNPFQSKDGIGSDHSTSAYDLLRQYLIQ